MGASLGARILAPRAVLLGTANPDSLENLIPTPYTNGALCWVLDQAALYYLAKDSMEAVSPPEVIATALGAGVPGRWIQYAGGSGEDLRPLHYQIYVDPTAPDGGTGSIAAPYNTLAAAVAAAPSLPASVSIFLTADDFTAEGFITYTDKHLHIQGQFLQNESGSTGTRGVKLSPTLNTTDDWLELEKCAASVNYQTFGCHLLIRDSFVDAFGNNAVDVYISGAAKTSRISSPHGQSAIGAIILNGGAEYAGGDLASFMECRAGVITGNVTLTNALIPRSSIQATNFLFCEEFTTAHPVMLTACTFDFATVFTGSIIVDLDTYARGVDAGVTWPEDTTIVDVNVTLQPFIASVGTGSNSNTNPTPAYGANETDDLFVCIVNGLNSGSPTLPAGWTKQDEISASNVTTQWWTRDTRSTGGEAGTITVTGAGASPTQAVILSVRNVAASAFIESMTSASAASGPPATIAGPTVTAGGKGRLAFCVSGTNGSDPTTTIAGETGGTWISKTDFPSGLGANINVQTAALGDSATVTGGTFDSAGNKVNRLGFALVGEVI